MSSDVRKGLEGVVVDETAISRRDINELTYRGYPVRDLANYCRFEEVAYLIWDGELPSPTQLDDFQNEKRKHREISDYLIGVIRAFPKAADPMDTLRTAVSYLGLEEPEAVDYDPAQNRDRAMRLLAKIPTIIATDYRHRKGLERIPPDPELGFAANFFNMYFGQVPQREVLDCFEIALILYAEHGFNPSTFTARIVASTLSDIFSATTAAIGALKGSIHGGANAGVMRMLLEIGEAERAQAWLDGALAAKRKIMGFGHRVYKRGDPRVPIMHAVLGTLADIQQDWKWLEIQEIVTHTMLQRKHMHPNIDYKAGPIYYLMGFDIDFFGPLFVMSRVVGWTAHFMEQLAFNRMIRPRSSYVGPALRSLTGRPANRSVSLN
jgi:citrate synthase